MAITLLWEDIKMSLYEQLTEAMLEENFYKTEEILSLISQEESLVYAEKILHFMEENPDVDYGMPGPVVHYLETLYGYGYEDLLYESVSRKPTVHTLWMLNRVLNLPLLANREKYLSVMEKAASDPDGSDSIRSEARSYLEYQNGNGRK